MGRRSKLLEPPPSNRGWTGSAAPVREHDAGEGTRRQGYWWGFCSIRNLPSACRRRVAPLMLQFPLFGGGEERRQQVHLGQLDSRTLSAPARPIARPLMCLHIRHIGALSPPMKQPPSTPTFPHQQPKVTIQPPRFGLSPERPITRRRLVTTKWERGPLPGLLTVDYFTTSPGGILAPHTRVSNVSRKTRVRHLAAQQHTS